MKVGDLVKCTWQPRCEWNIKKDCLRDMKVTIKGECGIIIEDVGGSRYQILFPKFNYTHPLADSAFEVINEDR